MHMDNVSSGETCLNFMTVGSLRRKLATDPDLRGVNVIVLDELHERDKLTDFLLMYTRRLLKRRPDLKALVMSATIPKDHIKQYFEEAGSAVVEIPGRTFHVGRAYLDQIVPMLWGTGASPRPPASLTFEQA